MKNITCIIIDDEMPAIALLEAFVGKTSLVHLQSFQNPLEALEFLRDNPVDIAFCDIQMKELSGLSLAEMKMGECQFIMTTAYEEYALKGYELNVCDYLLKPFSFERFLQAVNKAIKNINNDLPSSEIKHRKDFILIKADQKLHKLPYSEILYVEGLREYVNFITSNNKELITLESLKNLENNLPENFIRVHKSFIVNRDKVQSLYGNMLIINKKEIPIGKSYKKVALEKIFGKL